MSLTGLYGLGGIFTLGQWVVGIVSAGIMVAAAVIMHRRLRSTTTMFMLIAAVLNACGAVGTAALYLSNFMPQAGGGSSRANVAMLYQAMGMSRILLGLGFSVALLMAAKEMVERLEQLELILEHRNPPPA